MEHAYGFISYNRLNTLSFKVPVFQLMIEDLVFKASSAHVLIASSFLSRFVRADMVSKANSPISTLFSQISDQPHVPGFPQGFQLSRVAEVLGAFENLVSRVSQAWPSMTLPMVVDCNEKTGTMEIWKLRN